MNYLTSSVVNIEGTTSRDFATIQGEHIDAHFANHREPEKARLTWQPADWDHESTVQVAFTPSGDGKTVVRFHQDRLVDAREREQQRTHWRAVMASVIAALVADEP